MQKFIRSTLINAGIILFSVSIVNIGDSEALTAHLPLKIISALAFGVINTAIQDWIRKKTPPQQGG